MYKKEYCNAYKNHNKVKTAPIHPVMIDSLNLKKDREQMAIQKHSNQQCYKLSRVIDLEFVLIFLSLK